MSNTYFHCLGWAGSQPFNHVDLAAVYKPDTVEAPASRVCKGCSEKKTGRAIRTSVFKLHNTIVTTQCCD